MPTENDLVDLLNSIGDRAPGADHILDVLAPQLRTSAPGLRARRLLAVAAAVAAVAGVGIGMTVVVRGSGDTKTASQYADAEPITNQETYELPLDRYAASDTQRKTLERAQDVLEARCAQAQGVSPVRQQAVPHGDEARAFLTGIAADIRPLTIRQARSFGYEQYPGGLGPRDGIRTGTLTKAQARISRPCGEQATRTLLRGARSAIAQSRGPGDGQQDVSDDDLYVREVFLAEARAHSITPAVERAQRRWSACMADHGYPGLAATDDAINRQHGSASAAAKRQAVQDVTCKQQTGFMTVWVAALRDAETAVVNKHRVVLAGFEKRLRIRLANAARALS